MKPKEPICKSCGDTFVRYNTIQRLCVKCAIEKVKQGKDKAHRKELKEGRERLKTKSDWLREAQGVFNAYIRLRDKDKPCISCGTHKWTIQYHAGHFLTVKAHQELGFCEDNCHKQCSSCNSHLSGNIVRYRQNLIQKISRERVEGIEGPHEAKHYTIPDIQAIKAEYRQKAKELSDERG